MVGGVVGVLLLPAGQPVDGRGDLVFARKGHAVGSGGVVVGVVVIVEFGCVQHNILVPGNEDHTAGRGLLCAVLGRKGRVDCRVLQLPRNVAALGSVFIQQLGDDLIFIAGLAEVVDGHILRKLPCHLLGAVAEGVEPGLREVEFGVLGRDGPHQQIQQHHRCDHRCCNGSCGTLFRPTQIFSISKISSLFPSFQFQRRFSMLCAVKNGNIPVTVR